MWRRAEHFKEKNQTIILVSRLRSSQLPRMSLGEDAIYKPSFLSLIFFDVDSTDIVRHPQGGIIFHGELMTV